MKLSEYAKRNSITYRTAFTHWKKGYLKGKQLPSGTIVIENEDSELKNDNKIKAILYARVSSSMNKSNLESQMERLKSYAYAKGYIIQKEIKEIGAGLNDNRKGLTGILQKSDWNIIIVEHKDRLVRFGLSYMQLLLERNKQKIEIINETNSDKEDLIQDFVSIITSFTARLYGQRRSKRKTEKIIEELENE